jgi:hypothetical protein
MPEKARKNIPEGTKSAMTDPLVRQKISSKARGRPCPVATRTKLAAHFSKTRKGAGNPAAKQWKLVDPSGTTIITDDLSGFCKERELSYVGLKAAMRAGKTVQRGTTAGWTLSYVT